MHSIMVEYMLKNFGCSKDIVISGFLHIILEDTNYNYHDIEINFEKTIADNVKMITEDNGILDRPERKEKFLETISTYDNVCIMIELADKLHNLLCNYD